MFYLCVCLFFWIGEHFSFQIFVEYFKELEEESIRDNFVIIYELLDEVMDFGYPQTTDSKILQAWVDPDISSVQPSPHPLLCLPPPPSLWIIFATTHW